MLTLWDLLPGRKKARDMHPQVAPAAPGGVTNPGRTRREADAPRIAARAPRRGKGAGAKRRQEKGASAPPAPGSMQEKYDLAVRESLERFGIRVRKWRTSMSGIAWEVYYDNGRTARLIEAPRPTGPMSAAVFLHEIGHHAIGFGVYKPRCLEEHHAWEWALAEMERRGLNITDAVRDRVHRSMRYAIGKATRRGIKALPAEMHRYL